MTMKQLKIYRMILPVAALLLASACSDWTEMEPVENQINKPWEQDPQLWAEYTAALRAYKQSEHYIVYARMYNSPEKASSEQDFMRCLPDSLDIVSLTNADNFSEFDKEDMTVMHEKGTKVLYQIDYAARKSEFVDAQALDSYLERVISAVESNGMNGYSFTTDPLATEATARIVEKLSAAKTEDQIIVFEGSPLSLAAADRTKIDYIALDTEKLENVQEVKLQILNATGYAGIAPEKLLLSAEISSPMFDEERTEFAAVEEMARRVVEFGPVGGLAAYNISADYYHAEMNYQTIRNAIQTLNPAK